MSTTPGPAIRAARPADWSAIERLLTGRGLPPDGAREHLAAFVVAEQGSTLVGCAGLERYAEVGLLRSVAVSGDLAARGVGTGLVRASLDRARQLGLREVFLLTTTAAGFFPRFGFRAVPRAALPASLGASEEMRGACPASAIAMRLRLNTPEE